MESLKMAVARPAFADADRSFVSNTENSVTLLPAILDISQARSLHDTVRALLDTGRCILNASQVDRMSTPCAQVLLAAGRSASSAFRITEASPVFQAALADLGLEQDFSRWME